MAKLDWLRRPIAHRGLHDARKGIIENTASAVQAAIDADYAVEVDLRAAGNSEVMVFHDATLERLTHGAGELSEISAATLGRVRFKESRDRMQTLGDLFDQVDGRVPLILEIKSTWHEQAKFAARIAERIEAYSGHACVMSFDPHMIAEFARIDDAITRGLVAERFLDTRHQRRISPRQQFMMRHLVAARFAKPNFIAYDVDALPALAPWLGQRLFGWPLLSWTVRTLAQRRTAERWADAMIFEGFKPE